MTKYDELYGMAVIQPSRAVDAVQGAALWSPLRCWLHDQWEIARDALLFAIVVMAIRVLIS